MGASGLTDEDWIVNHTHTSTSNKNKNESIPFLHLRVRYRVLFFFFFLLPDCWGNDSGIANATKRAHAVRQTEYTKQDTAQGSDRQDLSQWAQSVVVACNLHDGVEHVHGGLEFRDLLEKQLFNDLPIATWEFCCFVRVISGGWLAVSLRARQGKQ